MAHKYRLKSHSLGGTSKNIFRFVNPAANQRNLSSGHRLFLSHCNRFFRLVDYNPILNTMASEHSPAWDFKKPGSVHAGWGSFTGRTKTDYCMLLFFAICFHPPHCMQNIVCRVFGRIRTLISFGLGVGS